MKLGSTRGRPMPSMREPQWWVNPGSAQPACAQVMVTEPWAPKRPLKRGDSVVVDR